MIFFYLFSCLGNITENMLNIGNKYRDINIAMDQLISEIWNHVSFYKAV